MFSPSGIWSAFLRISETRSLVAPDAGLPVGVTETTVTSPAWLWIGGETSATPGGSSSPCDTAAGNPLLRVALAVGGAAPLVWGPLDPAPQALCRGVV